MLNCIKTDSKNKCFGCMACVNACPKKAIFIETDERGFEYPKVDKNKCIECGLCKRKCYFSYEKQNNSFNQEYYGVKLKDEHVRIMSTSGGVFYALASKILSEDGVVYGVGIDNDMKVKHMRIDNINDMHIIMKSKYVQSSIIDIYEKIKNDIKNNKKILLSGTPCQIFGLGMTFGFNHDNIIYCDIVCHGVPSPMSFCDFISFAERKTNKKVTNFIFRTKENGWHNTNHLEKIEFDNNYIDSKSTLSQSFKYLFYSCNTMRETCFECPFSNLSKISDLTIGDFWGIEKINKEFDDDKGISLVLINTKKGKLMFENIKDSIEYFQTNKDSVLQPNLIKPTSKPKNYEQFWKEYNTFGFDFIMKKYTPYGFKNRIIYLLKQFVKKIIRRR